MQSNEIKNSFKLIKGTLEITNSEINIKYRKLKYALDLLKFFGGISLVSAFIDKVKNYEKIIGIYENIKFWIFGIASVYLVYLIFEFIFKRIWKFKIIINDIIKIEIENEDEKNEEIDDDSKIKIKIINSNGRYKKVELQKQNNQLEPFLEAIKKRNTRVKIVYTS
ncbi:hypothetical protein [Polaribacter aestuariivivens]|uniref:hypothetical protein n=1 Tax=Polaribacter aestuariivivens TaxID=2304626 RepID=UPI003F494AD3